MPNAQKMIFSATVPRYIQEIAKGYMKAPIMIDMVGDDQTQIPPTISNELVFVTDDFTDRHDTIRKILAANKGKKILIFLDSKREVNKMASDNVIVIHGDIGQQQRNYALQKFKFRKDSVMAATDVAARGLDVTDIDLVIQGTYQKGNIDSIVHRTGRTGRAGKNGRNIILGQRQDVEFFRKLENSVCVLNL